MKAIYICVIALLSAIIVITPAAATTWYVDDGGGPGIDYVDIQPAIEAADPGDTIFVYNGTYCTGHWEYYGGGHFSDSCFSVTKPNLTITGEGSTVVILDIREESSIELLYDEQEGWNASGCVIEGFKVVNSSGGIGAPLGADDCIIRNCVFEGLTNDYAIGIGGSNTTFVNNVVLNSQGAGHITGENCIYMNNVITGGTSIYASVRPDGNSCKFINNTITNGAGAGMLFYESNAVNNTIRKNNISSNAKGFWLYNAESSPYNEIHLNNIVDNDISVSYEYGSISYSTISWNSTEPIEYIHNGTIHTNYLGNYWGSDYT